MNKHKFKLFGFDKFDKEIVQYLSKNEWKSVSELSRVIPCPRTTIEYKLKSLKKRDLAVDTKVSKERQWSVSPYLEIGLENKPEIFSVKGFGNIVAEIQKIVAAKSRTKIIAIEPTIQSFAYFKKINHKQNIEISKNFKLGEHVTDGIIQESALEVLQTLSSEQLQEMYGRTVMLTKIPDKLLTIKKYTILYDGVVYFIEFQRETMQVIKNRELYENLKSFVENLTILGTKINLNKEIQKALNRQSK